MKYILIVLLFCTVNMAIAGPENDAVLNQPPRREPAPSRIKEDKQPTVSEIKKEEASTLLHPKVVTPPGDISIRISLNFLCLGPICIGVGN